MPTPGQGALRLRARGITKRQREQQDTAVNIEVPEPQLDLGPLAHEQPTQIPGGRAVCVHWQGLARLVGGIDLQDRMQRLLDPGRITQRLEGRLYSPGEGQQPRILNPNMAL